MDTRRVYDVRSQGKNAEIVAIDVRYRANEKEIDPSTESGTVIWKKNQDWIQRGREWLPELKKIKEKLEEKLCTKLDYAQLNYYRNGDDFIGWHTDSEVPQNTLIVSLSLGAERKFVLRHQSTFPNLSIYRQTPEKKKKL